jgi:hypothetical protein
MMSTESVLLQARLAVKAANENSVIYFALAIIGMILIGAWFVWVLENWSWIPRKKQRRFFGERF